MCHAQLVFVHCVLLCRYAVICAVVVDRMLCYIVVVGVGVGVIGIAIIDGIVRSWYVIALLLFVVIVVLWCGVL